MSRREHYLAMRLLCSSDGAPHFTAIDCLFIAYGPGHDRRRRAWERAVAERRARPATVGAADTRHARRA